MPTPSHDAHAELIWSMRQPWKASLRECLNRWRDLDPRWRTQSFLVLHGEAGARRTLDAAAIAALAEEAGETDCNRPALLRDAA